MDSIEEAIETQSRQTGALHLFGLAKGNRIGRVKALYPRERRDNDHSSSGIQGELVSPCRAKGQGRAKQARSGILCLLSGNEFFSHCLDPLRLNPSLLEPDVLLAAPRGLGEDRGRD